MKDNQYIDRILKYALKIMNYMKEIKSFEAFNENELIVDAVLFNLDQIGETARKVSTSRTEKYKEINWSAIIGLRNMISHEYEGMDITIIYFLAKEKYQNFIIY